MRNKTVGLLLRLRILMRRISSMSDSCKKKSSFFPTRGKFFCQEPVYEILFREETLLSSQDDIHLRKDLCVFSQGYEFLWEEPHLCLILVRMLVFSHKNKNILLTTSKQPLPRRFPFEQNLIFQGGLSEELLLFTDPISVWGECQFLSLLIRIFVLHPRMNIRF